MTSTKSPQRNHRKHLNIDISEAFHEAIVETMRKYGCSRTLAVTRLAGVGKFVLDRQENGDTIIIKDAKGASQAIRFQF